MFATLSQSLRADQFGYIDYCSFLFFLTFYQEELFRIPLDGMNFFKLIIIARIMALFQ
jgi:hypothetical protein